MLVHWFLKCQCSLLLSPVWPLPICLDSWTWHSRFLCNIALYSIRRCFLHQSHPQLGIVFALAPSLHSFWCYFSTDLGHLLTWGVPLSVSYHFAFSCCSWSSQGKNAEVVFFIYLLLILYAEYFHAEIPGLASLKRRTLYYLAKTFYCTPQFLHIIKNTKWSCSVVSDSLRPHGLYPTRLLHPWDFPGKNTGVGCHFLLQGMFPTQGSNPGLLHCRQTLYCLSQQSNTQFRFKSSFPASLSVQARSLCP